MAGGDGDSLWLVRVGRSHGVRVALPLRHGSLSSLASASLLGGRPVGGFFSADGRPVAEGELASWGEEERLYVAEIGEVWIDPPSPPTRGRLVRVFRRASYAIGVVGKIRRMIRSAKGEGRGGRRGGRRVQFPQMSAHMCGRARSEWERWEGVVVNEDRRRYLDMQRASRKLQSWIRRRRWQRILNSSIPIVKASQNQPPISPLPRRGGRKEA